MSAMGHEFANPEWSEDGTGLNRDTSGIVKAVWEHGSLGLDETSVMRCADAPRVLAARNLRLKTEHFAALRVGAFWSSR
jgi:hypothetical protein